MFPRSDAVPRSVHGLCVAVGLLFLLGMNSNAQVTIKERIELRPQISGTVLDNPLSTTLTVPAAGHLKITLNKGWRRGSAIPSSSHFYATHSGSGNVQDVSITTHLQHVIQRESTWCPCASPPQSPFDCEPSTVYFYFPDSSHPFSEFDFDIGDVLPGEEVNVFYQTYGPQGENLLSQVGELFTPDTISGSLVWVASAGPGNTYDCSWKYEETVKLTVIFSPADTVETFRIVAAEDTIGHGDATTMYVVAIDSNGYEALLDTTTLLRLTAMPDTLGSFIAANGDTTDIPLLVASYGDAKAGRIKFVANKSKPDSVAPVVIQVVQESDTTKHGSKMLSVKPNVVQLLLGETKYFQAREDPVHSDKLIIEELSTPVLSGGVASDVWGGLPLQAEGNDPRSAKTLGIYWEHQYVAVSTNSSFEMRQLPLGLIRLVGRFWRSDSVYKARLSANRNGRAGSILVEIKKPSTLGDFRRRGIDVNGRIYDVDSLSILWGGRFGIPPQFIKGQIEQESVFDESDSLYKPSYRFEPYTAQFFGLSQTSMYFVGSTIGTPPPPGNHQNVRYNYYFMQPETLWNIIVRYSELVETGGDITHRLYGKRASDGTMIYAEGYSTIRGIYAGFLERAKRKAPSHFADSANSWMASYLRDEWPKSGSYRGKGAKQIIAQTRMASSYGLLQMLYTTATGRNYREDSTHLPEYLNVADTIISYSIKYQKELLQNGLGESTESGSDWDSGFDTAFLTKVYWHWNSTPSYAVQVLAKSKNYGPKR